MYQNEEEEEAKKMQGSRKTRKDEEMAWAPPRNKSDWPGWEEATKTVESEWRLEPEGEAEVPEIIVVSDAVEGTFVCGPGWRKPSRAGRSKAFEKTEDTQDCVKEGKSTEQEEEENRTFVPSAVGVPRKPLFR